MIGRANLLILILIDIDPERSNPRLALDECLGSKQRHTKLCYYWGHVECDGPDFVTMISRHGGLVD